MKKKKKDKKKKQEKKMKRRKKKQCLTCNSGKLLFSAHAAGSTGSEPFSFSDTRELRQPRSSHCES